MGKGRVSIPLARCENLATMLAKKQPARGHCYVCGNGRDVDIAALMAIKGADYSLMNRRPPCFFTAGCNGRILFEYLHGGFWWPIQG